MDTLKSISRLSLLRGFLVSVVAFLMATAVQLMPDGSIQILTPPLSVLWKHLDQVLPALLVLLEVLIRLFPTAQDYSIINFLYRLLDALVPNHKTAAAPGAASDSVRRRNLHQSRLGASLRMIRAYLSRKAKDYAKRKLRSAFRGSSRDAGKGKKSSSSSPKPKPFDKNRWQRGADLPTPKESRLSKARRLVNQARDLVRHPRTVARMAYDDLAHDVRTDRRRLGNWGKQIKSDAKSDWRKFLAWARR